ncbi:inosine-5-monophosphate dehydrogenase [Amylibacter marinus]|uniref:Inosine-5-monophosphate dehydrogenase n=1 Tax=Amylibacter marinus TaxID=1475483 RepID=A0ABQ5VSM7_9RHOB|nr:CBS domain-containing protein [Amylibacter marinus]GLQ34267.1 inosine-5-monophosphate dehydrogenase [Amylibacter marinus]
MLIDAILKSKPNQQILTIEPDQNIRTALSDLSAHRIGVLVVSSDGTDLLGILSERDIVRDLAINSAGTLDKPVSALMTADVKTCSKSDNAEKVLSTMTAGRFRHMPVMDGSELLGLVSIGDVVKARLNEIEYENSAMVEMIRG